MVARLAGQFAAPDNAITSYRPTYFQNRIDEAALSALLSQPASFHLENVNDVGGTALRIAQALRGQGLNVRVRETRITLGQDAAMTMMPTSFGLLVAARLIGRDLIAWLRNPRPDVVVLLRTGAVEVRHKRRK